MIPKDRNSFQLTRASRVFIDEVFEKLHGSIPKEKLEKSLTGSLCTLVFSMALLRVEQVQPGFKAICHPLIWSTDVFRLTGTAYRGLQDLGRVLGVGYIEVGIPPGVKSLVRLAKRLGFAKIGTNAYNEEAWALPVRRL